MRDLVRSLVPGMLWGLLGSVGFLILMLALHTIGFFDWFGLFPMLLSAVALVTVLQPRLHTPAQAVTRTPPSVSAFLVMWWGFVLVAACVPDSWLRAKPIGTLPEADVWVVFGFGLNVADGEEHAGASNRALADWIAANHDGKTLLVVQHGIRLALEERAHDTGEIFPAMCLHVLPHDPKVYVNTKQATQQTVALLREWHKDRPLLVSHDLQLQRMVWDFAAAGYNDVVVPALPPIPFDEQSTQHWGTRGRHSWTVWELFFARPATDHGRWLLFSLLGLATLAAWNDYRTAP